MAAPDTTPWNALRLESGYRSDRALCLAADIPPGTLKNLMRGSDPTASNLFRLTDALNRGRLAINQDRLPDRHLRTLTDRDVHKALMDSRKRPPVEVR